MKLFLLEAKDDEKPWASHYDMFFGWVIRAENEAQARQMAQEKGGDEVGGRRGRYPPGPIPRSQRAAS